MDDLAWIPPEFFESDPEFLDLLSTDIQEHGVEEDVEELERVGRDLEDELNSFHQSIAWWIAKLLRFDGGTGLKPVKPALDGY